MQKGHLRSGVPVLLVALLLLSVLTLLWGGVLQAQRGGHSRPFGPHGTLGGASLTAKALGTRPIIGHQLPLPPPATMRPQQGSGPNPDQNLTPTATASQELSSNAAPGQAQNLLVFCSNGQDKDNDGKIDPTLPSNPQFDLWLMRPDGSQQTRLLSRPGDQLDPVFDPGGRLVCFASQVQGVWQIFTVEVRDPTIVRQITSGPGNKRHPTFSPDSLWIAYQCDLNGNWDLYKISADGKGQPVQLTQGLDDDTDPAWSPTGFVIAFTRRSSNGNAVRRIYTVTPDGSTVQAISNGGGDPTANDMQPAWRPDGTEIAFASDRKTENGDQVADYNIWRMPASGEIGGGAATLVSNTSATDTNDDTEPCWTQDLQRVAARIAWVSTRAGTPDIWAWELRDWMPPVLNALPTVEPRLATPGATVTISVPVYDRESGVQRVIARFKDPDRKRYRQDTASFDQNFTGDRYLEYDCEVVDQVVLTDSDGDGVFTGQWTTPQVAGGADYIVDIEVTDKAGNSLVYDDIYGFTTRAFAPQHDVLFVDDYCEGQLFLSQLYWNDDFAAAWPVESYWRFNPSTVPGLEGTVDFDSIRGGSGEDYDVWRIICRGPIPWTVYQYYLPTVEYQLDPAKLDNQGSVGVVADRPVPVADRAIIWAAPHTGNQWVAEGGIMDAATQADLALFVERGGRLFIAGEDIAWALTMNGTQPNTFVTNTLRARFLRDTVFSGGTINYVWLGRRFQVQRTCVGFDVSGVNGDPVADDPWGGGHADNWPGWVCGGDNPTDINTAWTGGRPSSEPANYEDCAAWSVRPDAIEPINATAIYSAMPGTSSSPAAVVGLRYQTGTALDGRLVFLSAGFEQFNRGYHQPSNLPPHCRNVRSHLLHNFLCWARTGGFQGRVISISDGGKPLNDPAPIVVAKQGGVVKYAVRCHSDGTYVMQGLPPGAYELEAARPGYEIDHYIAAIIHGGQAPQVVDFAIRRLQPGAVTGKVTSAATGEPLAGVTVSIAPAPTNTTPGTLPAPVVTGADGMYTLPSVPPGDYIVTADGTAVQYGKDDIEVTVNPGDTARADFALEAANGQLVVTVTNAQTQAPIRNAAVLVVDQSGGRTTVYTNDQGQAQAEVKPGTYTVSATASGYQPSATQTVDIGPAETKTIAIALQPAPGGAIVGRVVTAGSGAFVGGVTIRVFFGTEEVASTVTSASAVVTIGGVQYNYQLTDVPTGEMRVTAEKSGFSANPTERIVQIVSGQTTRDVNFTMASLHTFPRGLQLVSFPWDYSQIDPADLLGSARATFKMATWDASAQQYAYYPTAPADRFRLGVGYWMNLASTVDLSQEGQPANDPCAIPLTSGWNLIGCPFKRRIDFYTATVKRGTITYTLQQALTQGIIGSSLYAYMLGGYQTTAIMTPYVGYWLRANAPCTLFVSAAVGGLAINQAGRDATPQAPNGWLLQLKTQVGELVDTATYVGWARDATEGCDFGLDQFKPPAPTMGPYVYTAVDNRQWGQYGGEYAVDVRPAGTATTWELTVRTSEVGARVLLTWDDLSRLPRGVQPILVDLENGRRIYMRTALGYAFEATAEPRRLQLTISPEGIGALVVSPQAAQVTAAGAAISYTLSRSAAVEAVVTNIAGRVIRRLRGGETQAAGLNTLLWDGRDEGGRRVPHGRYLVTVIARTETGQEARAVLPLEWRVR